MSLRLPRLLVFLAAVAALLVGIFATAVLRFRSSLREEIHRTIVDRDAAVLLPVAQRQLAQRESDSVGSADLLSAVLESAHQDNMLAVAVFDADGRTLKYAPESLLFPELSIDDFIQLHKLQPISRFHAGFPLDRYFSGVGGTAAQRRAPVLEVLLPLHGRDPRKILGFAQYYIDARPLAAELTATDRRIGRQTSATLALGSASIVLVVAAAGWGLQRARRVIAERNERLARTNAELAFAAKASAVGQITSHLLHGLQGSLAGLRAVVDERDSAGTAPGDWATAASYTHRMQALVQETVTLLGEANSGASFELTGEELAAVIGEQSRERAAERRIDLRVASRLDRALDNHRGSLLCLIAANLVQNAVAASPVGGAVSVELSRSGGDVVLTVSDEGPGIPEAIRGRLFDPGVSGRPGGTGLGLAISRLLARQMRGDLTLLLTGAGGTTFRTVVPES